MCNFLTGYSGWLLGCGSTCIRLEKNVARIAAAYGMRVDMSIMPHHIHLTVSDKGQRHVMTSIASVNACPISFEINTRLSRLSWDMADHKIDFDSAVVKFNQIVKTPGRSPIFVLLAASVANASFCRLFGGDITAMSIVFIATLVGFMFKQTLSRRHLDNRLVVIICSFISAVLAAGDGLFHLGSTPGLTIGTSVLYLVPGIPFINSFCDMIDGHYICAFGRLMNAVVITCCLSVGLCAGMLIMHIGMF